MSGPRYPADLHAHSLFSRCGVHTVLEMLEASRRRGLQAQAITDHGPIQGGRVNSVFWERLKEPLPGIQLLKGLECNVKDEEGTIDFPQGHLSQADLVLLGIHGNTPRGKGRTYYTELILRAVERNPWVDIITHPNDINYPVDFRVLARAAREGGFLLEMNNSKVNLGRSDEAVTRELMEVCAAEECPVAVNSDAHTVNEAGHTEAVDALLDKVGFPRHLIVNRSMESLKAFLALRRTLKESAQ